MAQHQVFLDLPWRASRSSQNQGESQAFVAEVPACW